MVNSFNASPKAQQVLKEVLEQVQDDHALDFHLPEEVTSLDKAAILAILYRVLAQVK